MVLLELSRNCTSDVRREKPHVQSVRGSAGAMSGFWGQHGEFLSGRAADSNGRRKQAPALETKGIPVDWTKEAPAGRELVWRGSFRLGNPSSKLGRLLQTARPIIQLPLNQSYLGILLEHLSSSAGAVRSTCVRAKTSNSFWMPLPPAYT